MEGDEAIEPDEILQESFPAIPFMPEGVGALVFRTVMRKGSRTFEGLAWTREEADEKARFALQKHVREHPGTLPDRPEDRQPE